MSATISTQSHLYPFSGTANWEDGSGMHTWIAMDGIKFVNNLLYTDLPVSSPMSPRISFPSGETPYGALEQPLHSSSREVYMGQAPIILKAHAKRLLWTAGVALRSVGGSAVTMTAVKLYLSAYPYRGPVNVVAAVPAFLTSMLSPDYLSRSVTVTHSTSGTQYQLADDSTTGITPVLAPSFGYVGQDRLAYMVVTCTGDGDAAQTYARIHDFTAWQVYE